MIRVQQLATEVRITLTPNRSLSWFQSKLVLAFVGGFCLSIAIVWSILGAWFILPFAGLEVALLSLVMYLVSKATYQQQSLIFYPDNIVILKGRSHRQQHWRLVRQNTRLCWPETYHPEDVKKLSLSDKQHAVLVGEFLNLADQELLIEHCQTLGLTTVVRQQPLHFEF
jgi:uncharacterized membrane protein